MVPPMELATSAMRSVGNSAVSPASECASTLEQEPLLRALFDHAPLAQFIGAPDGAIERVNPAFTSLLGYSADEICGKSVMSITHPDDIAKSWANSRRVGLSLPRLSFQKRYLHKSGRAVSTLVTLSAVETGGRRCLIAQIVDLTAIKQAHSKAEHAHERLQTAMEAAVAGTWELDVATGHMEWDESMRRQFGLGPADPTPTLDGFIAAVHEDDRRSVVAAMHNAMLPGHGRFDHEYRIKGADGVERWYRSAGRVRRDDAGRAVGGVGIAFDITRTKQGQLDRERMMASLHRAERRLAAIVANSRDAIIGATLDLKIASWNAAAQALYGWSEAEAIGMPVDRIVPEDRRPSLVTRVASMKAGESLPAILSVGLRKDGTLVDVEISLSPVVDEAGKLVGYSGIVRDITERLRTERWLRQSQMRLEEIAHSMDQVFWTADPAIERMLYVSPSYERIWGRTCASLYADPRSFIEGVHPDDRDRLVKALATHAVGDDFAAEYRVVRPDGSVRHIADSGHPVRNADGNVTHYVGVAVDTTERPAREQHAARPR